jgi:signal transduction histidine kinase
MQTARSIIATWRGSRGLRFVLDVAIVGFVLATFLQLWDADVLLHGVWVVLVLQAFLYGLRVSLIRIAIATLVVVVYASLTWTHALFEPLEPEAFDFAEWPLMVLISVLVAIMADRQAAISSEYTRLYRETSDRLLTAQEDERARLARDLHDGVGQTLTALTLTLDAAESVLWAGEQTPSGLSRAAILRAQEIAAIALEDTRDVAGQLRPARLHQTGLAAAIRELAVRSGLPMVVRVDPATLRRELLAPEQEIEVYRIVQEALGNAARHSGAEHVWVGITERAGRLRIEVGDDGRGFHPAAVRSRGLGLAGMRDRATIAGATLVIRSAPSRGTAITLTVPLAEPPSAPAGPIRPGRRDAGPAGNLLSAETGP